MKREEAERWAGTERGAWLQPQGSHTTSRWVT